MVIPYDKMLEIMSHEENLFSFIHWRSRIFSVSSQYVKTVLFYSLRYLNDFSKFPEKKNLHLVLHSIFRILQAVESQTILTTNECKAIISDVLMSENILEHITGLMVSVCY